MTEFFGLCVRTRARVCECVRVCARVLLEGFVYSCVSSWNLFLIYLTVDRQIIDKTRHIQYVQHSRKHWIGQ